VFVCLFVCFFHRTFPFLHPCSECTLYPHFLSLTLSVILFTLHLVPICSSPAYLPFTHLLLSSIPPSQTSTLSPSSIFLSYPPLLFSSLPIFLLLETSILVPSSSLLIYPYPSPSIPIHPHPSSYIRFCSVRISDMPQSFCGALARGSSTFLFFPFNRHNSDKELRGNHGTLSPPLLLLLVLSSFYCPSYAVMF
jgi:hypothetical protein